MNAPIKRIRSYPCPCCGGPIGEAPPIENLLIADLTRQQKTIIKALSKTVGAWVDTDLLVGTLIVEAARSTLPTRDSLHVQICRAQSVLRPLGWFIQSDKRGSYRLIPSERSAA